MINNQINRRIGSCEGQLFLARNRKKEKKRGFAREIARARRKRDGEKDGEKRGEGVNFCEEERNRTAAPLVFYVSFRDAVIYNSISVCSPKGGSKRKRTRPIVSGSNEFFSLNAGSRNYRGV